MVFYRKYRPQKIDDLDSEAVRDMLLSVLKNPAHAFLFTGPKGLGKTSTARIIAKVVNCTGNANAKHKTENRKQKEEVLSSELSVLSGEALEPCNNCEQCDSINKGLNMDILEIDAASNRGIDEIRDLKEKIRLSPLSAHMKVYIIDEVHMLTTEAFNALLKTLEEPPEHAMFILCTTEPQKVPATIISRCLHIGFNKATDEELVRALTRITKGEKITIDKDALFYIASLSDGSFRDGTKILEEVALQSGGKQITKKNVEEKYHTVGVNKCIDDLLTCLKERNTKNALQLISEVMATGADMKHFLLTLIEQLHEIMLFKIGVKNNVSADKNDYTIDEVKNLFELLSRANTEMRYAVLPQLPLELAIVEWGLPLENDFIHKVDDSVSVTTLRKQVGNIKKNQAMYGDTDKDVKKIVTPTAQPVASLMHASASGQLSPEWLDALWRNIISEMKNHNHTIAGVLRGCAIKSYDKKSLVIETSYKFHKERLDDMKTSVELARICKLLTGKDIAVVVELKKI